MTQPASEHRAFTSIAALSVAGTLVRLLSGIAVTKVMALSLGAAGFAQFSQAQNLVGLLAVSMATGLGNGVTSTIAAERGQSQLVGAPRVYQVVASAATFATWLTIPLAIALVAVADAVAKSLFGDASLAWLVRSAAAALPFACLAPIPLAALNGQQEYLRCVIAPMITTLLGAVVSVSLVSSLGMVGAALSIVGSAAITLCINAWLLASRNKAARWFDWIDSHSQTRSLLLRFALMAAIGGMASQGSLMFVRTTLADAHGWHQTGQWQAIIKISEVYLSAITTALTVYYLPRLAALTSRHDFVVLLRGSMLRILPATVALAVGIYIFKEPIFRLAFSDEFAPAADMMGIQLVGDVFKVTSFLFAMVMWARGMMKAYLVLEITVSLLYAGLAWWLSGPLGPSGALLAHVAMYAVYLCMCAYVALRMTKWDQPPPKGRP